MYISFLKKSFDFVPFCVIIKIGDVLCTENMLNLLLKKQWKFYR